MPATAMASDPANYASNPSDGKFVLGSPYSSCVGASHGAYLITGWNGTTPIYAEDNTNFSTGGVNTGIGFGAQVIDLNAADQTESGFTNNYVPGGFYQPETGPVAAANSIMNAIGGGNTAIVSGTGANGNGAGPKDKVSNPTPYGTIGLVGFGNGSSRDAGTNGTGFNVRSVAATASVAEGAVISSTYVNRSGRTLVNGERTFGSNTSPTTAIAAPPPRP